MTSDDTYLVALPAGHNFPLGCPGLLGAMTVGAPTVFTPRPQPRRTAFAPDRQTPRHGRRAWSTRWPRSGRRPATGNPCCRRRCGLVQVGGSRMTAEEAKFILDNLTPGLSRSSGWPRAC